jgi:hypothetical protein
MDGEAQTRYEDRDSRFNALNDENWVNYKAMYKRKGKVQLAPKIMD